MRRIWILTVMMGVALLGGNSAIYAQENPIPVPPPPETENMESIEAYVERATLEAQAELSNYRIVYLVEADALNSEDVAHPSRFNDNFGATIAHNWQELQDLNDEAPIDAIILHETALNKIDNAQLSEYYKNGVVIVLINIYHPQVAELLGLQCEFEVPQTWYPDNYVVIYHLKVAAAYPHDAEKAIAHYTGCKADELKGSELSAPIQATYGSMNENLDVWYGYYALVTGLNASIASVKEMDTIQQDLIRQFGDNK